MNVARSFVTYIIAELILQRNLTNVIILTKLLPKLQALLGIRKSILNRNIINFIYVTVLLFKAQALWIIRELIVERNLQTIIETKFIQGFKIYSTSETPLSREAI